jgi:hypothetical protein
MGVYIAPKLRTQLVEVDNQHCAYCYTREAITGQVMSVDHVLPASLGGKTAFDNLCFCCRRCNEFKGSKIDATDPLTGETVMLYHPRRENWQDHFAWDETGTLIIGLTSVGRATVVGLNMNDVIMVDARSRWVAVGWHPPDL